MSWPSTTEMLTATLVRNDARWPAYITGTPWRRHAVDVLYEDDRLTLPRCATGTLVMQVVRGFSSRPQYARHPLHSGGGVYALATDCPCPQCGAYGVHDITVHTDGRMGRTCFSCEHNWAQAAEVLEHRDLEIADVLAAHA